LGDQSFVSSPSPVSVVGLVGIVEVAAGDNHSCARDSAGRVYCWGEGRLLGSGTDVDSAEPVAVVGLDDAVEIVSGFLHACARRQSGSVWCWGANDGRLGNGDLAATLSPVEAVGISNAISVATGWGHTCVASSSGRVQCTGTYNNWGQTGGGTTDDILVANEVLNLSDARAVAVGAYHSCAVHQNLGLSCWGNDQSRQLGDGERTDDPNPAPARVAGIDNVVQVVGTAFDTCVLLADGSVACWGSWGEHTAADPAAKVPGVDNASELGAGTEHVCARLESGEIRCWDGNNPEPATVLGL
jgi:alpha-tubulin suppressor-like RCC1 family protein